MQSEEVHEYVPSSGSLIALNVPSGNTAFKAYMDYSTITDISSRQWEMQQSAYTGDYGIREIDGRYCVAIGTGYGAELGDKLTVVLDSGIQFDVIVADIKMDIHTDETRRYTPMSGDRKNVLEFIVHTEYLNDTVRTMGNLDFVLRGNVKEISYVK